jgi:hypothetical protein
VVVYELMPRPVKAEGLVVLDESAAPGLRRLVSSLSAELGVKPPMRIGVDTSFNACAGPIGWLHHSSLVVGPRRSRARPPWRGCSRRS